MNRPPPTPPKTCSVSSLIPTSDRWSHGLILMQPYRFAPRSPTRQGHSPHQALPRHLAHSYLRHNDDGGCSGSLLRDGLDEYLQRSWLKRLRQLGLEVLAPLWRHIESKSEATRSRWQWTWAVDDSVFHKYGEQLGLVGPWWSGQQHRVLSGIDGLLLVVVIGDGKLVVPVDFAIRRPKARTGAAPCADHRG
jgi:hypothetical protein